MELVPTVAFRASGCRNLPSPLAAKLEAERTIGPPPPKFDSAALWIPVFQYTEARCTLTYRAGEPVSLPPEHERSDRRSPPPPASTDASAQHAAELRARLDYAISDNASSRRARLNEYKVVLEGRELVESPGNTPEHLRKAFWDDLDRSFDIWTEESESDSTPVTGSNMKVAKTRPHALPTPSSKPSLADDHCSRLEAEMLGLHEHVAAQRRALLAYSASKKLAALPSPPQFEWPQSRGSSLFGHLSPQSVHDTEGIIRSGPGQGNPTIDQRSWPRPMHQTPGTSESDVVRPGVKDTPTKAKVARARSSARKTRSPLTRPARVQKRRACKEPRTNTASRLLALSTSTSRPAVGFQPAEQTSTGMSLNLPKRAEPSSSSSTTIVRATEDGPRDRRPPNRHPPDRRGQARASTRVHHNRTNHERSNRKNKRRREAKRKKLLG